ncbi:hypothetical protein SNE40_020741 [Patella caerulea]|uniref:Integrase catalytic domain-containing protein n=1 Tax=Patella caerulea TaxID=87958 RepID=A0AAN8P3M5_PATCE
MVSKCEVCLENRLSNQKEPMILSRIPSRPWEVIATDLFPWDNSDYLIAVDYYSRFYESPYHAQANGLVEKTVQTVKRLLTKSKSDGIDPYLGMIDYRDTLIDNIASPSQL